MGSGWRGLWGLGRSGFLGRSGRLDSSEEALESGDLRLHLRNGGEDGGLAHSELEVGSGKVAGWFEGTYGWPAGRHSIFFAGDGWCKKVCLIH